MRARPHLQWLLIGLGLGALAACGEDTPAPESRITVVLDQDAIFAQGSPFVHIRVGPPGEVFPLSGPSVVELELTGDAPLGPFRYTFDCRPGERVAIGVGASTSDICTGSGLYDSIREVTCERGETLEVGFGPLEPLVAFIECAVDFDEPFCSFKVDGAAELLHDADGVRQPSVVVASACAFDVDAHPDAALFASDLRVTCGDRSVDLPVAGAPSGYLEAPPPIAQAWRHAAIERLVGPPTFDKLYLNSALRLDFASIGDALCTVRQIVAPTLDAVAGDVLPAGAVEGAFRIEALVARDGALIEQRTAFDADEVWIDADDIDVPLHRVVMHHEP